MNQVKPIQILSLLLLLSLETINAQNQKADSLEKVLKSYTATDTTKVNLLNQLAHAIYSQDAKRAKVYLEESEKLADQIHYLKGKAIGLRINGLASLSNDSKAALNFFQKALTISENEGNKIEIYNCLIDIGEATSNLGDIKTRDESYKKALQIAREINHQRLIIKVLINTSKKLSEDSNYPEAIKQLQDIVRIAKEIGDEQRVSNSYAQLGLIYARQANYRVALEYYLSALTINEKINNTSGIFYNLVNISSLQAEQKNYDAAFKTIQKAFLQAEERGDSLQMTIGLINLGNFRIRRDPNTSLKYFQKALALVKDNNIRNRIVILTKIGSIYTTQKKFEQAVKNLEEALELAQKINSKRSLGEIRGKMGILYFVQEQYNRSIVHTEQALQMANKTNHLELQKDSYKQLSEVYAATGSFQKAYQSLEKFKILSDSILNEDKIREMTILESNYKYDKEKQVYEMKQANQKVKIQDQKRIILFLVIVSILILSLAFAVYWTNKLKKKVLNLEIKSINQELEINQKAMTAATLKLVQSSERNTHSIKILENIKKDTMGDGQSDIRSLIADYKLITYDSNWDEFEILFEKVNGSFYKILNERYPNLTPNEKKLCVFLKLNMSNSHISQVTFQSEEALKKARSRLRKKLQIDSEINLVTFIQSL